MAPSLQHGSRYTTCAPVQYPACNSVHGTQHVHRYGTKLAIWFTVHNICTGTAPSLQYGSRYTTCAVSIKYEYGTQLASCTVHHSALKYTTFQQEQQLPRPVPMDVILVWQLAVNSTFSKPLHTV